MIQSLPPREPQRSKNEVSLISEQLAELLTKRVIEEVEPVDGPFISNIFQVPKTSGGHRLIINLKDLTTFIDTDPF